MLGLKLCALGHSDPDTNFGLGNFTQYLNSEVNEISKSYFKNEQVSHIESGKNYMICH